MVDRHLVRAERLLADGDPGAALASLNEYLVTAGRDAQYYREALELLDSADVRLQREDAERTRPERWPPGHVFRDCELCPEMVVMPGSLLALGRYEVTVGEYRAFASSTGSGPTDCLGGVSWRDQRHRRQMVRPMAGHAVLVENRRHVAREGRDPWYPAVQ